MIPRRRFAWAVVFFAGLLILPLSERVGNVVTAARPEAGERKGESPGRVWPVDVPVHLSSSFGEFRSGHLHAGVDIRSFGREGIPCRAVGPGYVARLRASPEGYGKAVYVKLDSGEVAVYAHLSEFAADIESVVVARQLEQRSYRVDFYPPPGTLTVKEGQIIAYTGRTGAAAPHLHFEMRDAAERPVNPLDIGWELPDRVPPTIRRLQCVPLSTAARVNGRFAPAVVELRSLDARTFSAPDTLRVAGTVGFGAQIVDRVGDSSGDLAPYRVELEIDGERVSVIEMSRFAYDQTGEVELVYDIARARTRSQHFLLLFRRRGETLGHRDFVHDGVVDTGRFRADGGNGDGVRRVVVRATDRAGNVSTATWAFVVSPPGAPGPGSSDEASSHGAAPAARGELPGFYFFEDMMSVQGRAFAGGDIPETARDGASSGGVAGDIVLSFDAVGEAGRTLSYRVGEGTREVHVVAARRDGALRREFADLGVGLEVGRGSLYSNSLLYLARWERSVAPVLPAGSGARALTRGVRFGPVSATLKAPAKVLFFAPNAPADKAAVFRFDERRETWSFRPSSVRGDTVSASIREPGVYAVLVDSLPPKIGAPQLASRKSFATGSTVREVIVAIVDEGSGVDADRTEVYIDGKKQIARWDGFLEKMIVILRDENIIGVRGLSVVAVDRMGNSTRLVTQLQVPPPAKQGGTGGFR